MATMKKLLVLLYIVAGLASLSAQQIDTAPNLRLLVEAGLEFGDQPIMDVIFPNGEIQPLDAGFGVNLLVGGQLRFDAIRRLSVRTFFGVKYNQVSTTDNYVFLMRFPLTAMGYWEIVDDARVGVGATTHLWNRFRGGNLFVEDKSYASTVGPRFEVGYKWIGLTYTVLKYTEAVSLDQFRADSFGVFLSFLIPMKTLDK